MAVNQQLKDLNDFIELTSDEVIREAAYPKEEWIENGGNIATGLLGGTVNNYSKVTYQDEPPLITKYSGLLYDIPNLTISQDTQKRLANTASHWQKVQAHQYYKTLSSDDNFKRAFETFQTKKNSTTAPSGLKSEFADIRFYNLIALHIGVQKIYDALGYKRTYPDRKLLKQAKGHIQKLLSDFSNGVKLSDYQSQSQLQNYLNQLIDEIDQAPRKDNETATATKRRRLERFALVSINKFGEASATILGHLALMLGWDDVYSNNKSYSHKTMEVIVKNAKIKVKKEQLKALANALKTPVQKG